MTYTPCSNIRCAHFYNLIYNSSKIIAITILLYLSLEYPISRIVCELFIISYIGSADDILLFWRDTWTNSLQFDNQASIDVILARSDSCTKFARSPCRLVAPTAWRSWYFRFYFKETQTSHLGFFYKSTSKIPNFRQVVFHKIWDHDANGHAAICRI